MTELVLPLHQKEQKSLENLLRIIKWIGIIILVIIFAPIILVFVIIILSARGINSVKYRISTETGIQTNAYVMLNGTEQFISIRGKDITNPIILFLHGGPGTPLGYTSHYFQTNLEDDYTMVHWDQRGCGRTYINDRNFSVDKLSTELLLDDLDKLVDYLREKFDKKKIILMGTSWGTVLGTQYILNHPQKISDYIAIGYAMNLRAASIIFANKALDLAKKAKNTKDVGHLQRAIATFTSINTLENLNVETFTTNIRICSKYLTSKEEMSLMGQIWMSVSSPYINIDDIKWYLTILNFEKFFELSVPLLNYAMFNYDANTLDCNFEVPVYVIQGENDWITPTDPVQEYFEKINAPKKELVIVPNSGHNPYFDYPKKFGTIVKGFLNTEL